MAERLVDRAKKCAALALPLLRGEPVGDTIEVFVLPAVVARHTLYIGTVDHGALITVMAGELSHDAKAHSQGRFCLADDGLERRRFADREIGQHLAVNRDAGFGEAGDEAAVVEAKRTNRGVEALNPQSAKAALAPLAVAIGVLVGLLDRLLGNPNRVLAAAIIPLGGLEHFLVLGMGGDSAFDASHE